MTSKNLSGYLTDDSTDDDWMGLFQDISNASDDEDDNSVAFNEHVIHNAYNSMMKNINMDVLVNTEVPVHNICSKCNVECIISDGTSFCGQCGLENDIIDDNTKFSFSVDRDHNTSDNSFMSFNFVGKNSYCYQRSFLKTCANYSSFRRNNNRKDLYNYNYQYEGKKIPKNAIKLAIELFSTIKDNNNVYRGNGKKGVLGACLFYACVMNNITKTPREIASVMDIEERFLSHGDRKVQELNEKNIISIPTVLRPLKDYLDQYLPALKIPDKYKQFIVDIIERAEKKNIHIKNDSRTTTKAIGSIYLLINRIKSLSHITKDHISKECNISKSTFNRYYSLLMENSTIIKPVFIRHSIPMPNEWREITVNTVRCF